MNDSYLYYYLATWVYLNLSQNILSAGLSYTWAFLLAAILYWLSIYLCQFSYWAITFLLTWPALLIVLLSTGMGYKLCFIVTSISDTNKLNKYFTFDRVTWFVFKDVFQPFSLISLTNIHVQRWHVCDQPFFTI